MNMNKVFSPSTYIKWVLVSVGLAMIALTGREVFCEEKQPSAFIEKYDGEYVVASTTTEQAQLFLSEVSQIPIEDIKNKTHKILTIADKNVDIGKVIDLRIIPLGNRIVAVPKERDIEANTTFVLGAMVFRDAEGKLTFFLSANASSTGAGAFFYKLERKIHQK